jgi:hypothetical protein
MKHSTKLNLLAFSVLVPAVSLPLLTNAASSNATQKLGRHRPAAAQVKAKKVVNREQWQNERQEAQTAINNNDYNAWLKAVGADSFLGKTITQEKFAEYIQARSLIKQGQDKLKTLGLPGPNN